MFEFIEFYKGIIFIDPNIKVTLLAHLANANTPKTTITTINLLHEKSQPHMNGQHRIIS